MNEKVIGTLRKFGPVDLNDPITRIALIGELGSIRRVKRENVITAIDIASRKSDSVIDTDKERKELAVLITRQANRDKERVPMARALSGSMERLRRRKWTFDGSKGKGIRTFDRTWKGALVADSKTKRGANNLAKFLRKNNVGKVRVVPYSSGKRTHYSVYSQKRVQVANKKQLKSAMKGMTKSQKESWQKHNDLKAKSGNHLITTKKNIPKLGLKFRR
jgi:hypothetical protein